MKAVALLLAFALPVAAFPVPRPAQAPTVAGTTWAWTSYWGGNATAHVAKITFLQDGILTYHGDQPCPSSWTQDGNIVTWSVNSGASTHRTILNGSYMEGTGNNGHEDCHSLLTIENSP